MTAAIIPHTQQITSPLSQNQVSSLMPSRPQTTTIRVMSAALLLPGGCLLPSASVSQPCLMHQWWRVGHGERTSKQVCDGA
ncbi:MAG: hypothetical protein JO316_20650 [Abitibacteriaceae bacterium]|nr:hypothetical protein [Abditibacteriaceae bacterium]MBV9867769.1 hypothetical protein [Abditibacteriaceae bacterium]